MKTHTLLLDSQDFQLVKVSIKPFVFPSPLNAIYLVAYLSALDSLLVVVPYVHDQLKDNSLTQKRVSQVNLRNSQLNSLN